jgi:acetyltransferase-like isoleucine patch superfamily enzyme
MLKIIIKRTLLFIGVILTLPLIILTWLEKLIEYSIINKRRGIIYMSCKEILAICPTIIGEFLRLGYYWAVCTKISPDANLLFGSMLAHRETIIGTDVVIGPFCFIGFADIEDRVMFGARVSVISGKYQHGRPDQRTASEGEELTAENERIRIGKNSWIGQDAVIMANVGQNCTVGAGSVVYKDVPDNTTVLGNPARKVNLG